MLVDLWEFAYDGVDAYVTDWRNVHLTYVQVGAVTDTDCIRQQILAEAAGF